MGKVISRPQKPAVYTGNLQVDVIQLQKNLVYDEIAVTLRCQPTLTAANNTVANTAYGDEWGVVKKIEVFVNSTDCIFSMSGAQLRQFNRMVYKTLPPINALLGIGTGGGANPAIVSTLIIPFMQPDIARPFDTILRTDDKTELRVEVTWGTFTDINSAATAWTAEPVLQFTTEEAERDVDPNVIVRNVCKLTRCAGAQDGFRIPLDTGPYYRGWILNAQTGGQDTAGLWTKVKVVLGPTNYREYYESALAYKGRQGRGDSGCILKTSAGIPYNSAPYVSTKLLDDGWYNLDLLRDGRLGETINSVTSECFLEFITTAAVDFYTISRQVIYLTPPAAAA